MPIAPAIVLALALAPALARAGSGDAIMACFAGLAPDDYAARFEAYADRHAFDARMRTLCAAGDRAGVAALATEIDRGFLAADPEAAAVRACLADLTGADADAGGEVCDAYD